MRELSGVNLFSYPVICITTNGTIKNNGAAVMGAGCAQTVRDQFPGIDAKLGGYLKQYGNRPFILGQYGGHLLVSFPVKHHWDQQADIELIKKSAQLLMPMLDKFGIQEIHIPRPGCGNGKLNWSNVKPAIAGILDDRCVIVTF